MIEGVREFTLLADEAIVERARAILGAAPDWLSTDGKASLEAAIRDVEQPRDDFGRRR